MEDDVFESKMEEIVDIYCLGEQPLERWRPFVNIKEGKLIPPDWRPEQQYDHFITKREWQARVLYQYTQLQDLCADWEILSSLTAFRRVALLELRSTEFSLAEFQLLCGMVGIDNRTTSYDELYYAAVCCHSFHLYLHDTLAKCRNVKKSNRKEVLAEKPSRTDKFADLALNLCNQVQAIHLYYEPTYSALRASASFEPEMDQMGKRAGMVIVQLDSVLCMTTDSKCDKLKVASL